MSIQVSKQLGTELDILASLGGAASTANTSTAITSTKGIPTSLDERALKLLGSGVLPEQVAAALGVTAGRISQLLSDDVFAEKVATLRYANLQQHNERDSAYDSIEDELLTKLRNSLPLMIRPDTILKAIGVINSAKRRGQSAPHQVTNQQTVVQLVLPTLIAQKFSVNSNNQVIRTGEQDLLTMQSGNLLARVEEATNGADAVKHAGDKTQGGQHVISSTS
jgi:hypothetical protein